MKILALAIAIAATSWSTSTAAESCPGASTIRSTGGVHTAPTRSGQGEWLGISTAGSNGKIKRFDSAHFYPEEGHETAKGRLSKCSYILEQGLVDLHYKAGSEVAPWIKLNNIAAWEKMKGPFGINYYECNARQATECQFEEIPG